VAAPSGTGAAHGRLESARRGIGPSRCGHGARDADVRRSDERVQRLHRRVPGRSRILLRILLPPLSLHRLSAVRDSVGYGTGSSVGQGTPEGTTIIKVFLNVSRDEQKERFQERLDRPDKNWKFRAGDLDDRELWPEFMEAYTDAIEKTSADRAPWYVVPADRKWARNVCIARILRDHLETIDPQYPGAEDGIGDIIII
jgi:hypothetical protein